MKELRAACEVAAAALVIAAGDVSRGAQAKKRAEDAKGRAYDRMRSERAYNLPDDQFAELMAHHAQCGERILAAIRVHGSAEEIQSCAAL